MYRSREIRWFSRTENPLILKWFLEKHPWLSTSDPRADYYLYFPDREDLGIKLREGNVEVKHRVSEPYAGPLGNNSRGYFEDWIKWSFTVDKTSELASEILENHSFVFDNQWPFKEQLKGKTSHWIAIHKVRLGLKLAPDENGNIQYFHIKDYLEDGCQVEYTKIAVLGKTWYTFGFEWFGRPITFKDSLYEEILGGTKLKPEDSYGYAKFLSLLNQNRG